MAVCPSRSPMIARCSFAPASRVGRPAGTGLLRKMGTIGEFDNKVGTTDDPGDSRSGAINDFADNNIDKIDDSGDNNVGMICEPGDGRRCSISESVESKVGAVGDCDDGKTGTTGDYSNELGTIGDSRDKTDTIGDSCNKMSTITDSDLAVNVVLELDDRLHKFRNLWNELGIDGCGRAERVATIIRALGSVLDEMADKEQHLKDELLKSIDVYRTQIGLLSTELHLPLPDESYSIGKTSLPLKERELQQQVDALAEEKAERIRLLEQLCDADRQLCATLDAAPFDMPGNVAVPTRELLQQLDAHVTARRSTKDERQSRLLTDRSTIVALYGELGYEPGSVFELNLAAQEPDCFVLSEENMKALGDLLERLVRLRQERLAVGTKLREQLTALWRRLELPAAELDVILSSHCGHRQSDIEALRREIESCEQRRVQQVQRCIENSRQELLQWWGKCYYSEKQRAAFKEFTSEAFSEELLRAHEVELGHVRVYYEANRKLLQKLERWDELWRLKTELVTKERDPARLENRGGVLLDEEEERKKITLLPKVEEQLKEAVKAWEASSGRSFLCNGVKFATLCRQRREEYDRKREEEKQQRLNRRRTLTPGSPIYLT